MTGRRTYLREKINGTDDAAWGKAQNALTQLRARVLRQRLMASTVTFGYAVDEWLRTADIEQSTRDGYVGYIDRVIKPVLGDVAVSKLGAWQLENLYADLRRCRMRCDGKPFIEKHKAKDEHDCAVAECVVHRCKPMAASTVRQIHSIISSVLNAAVRWEWIETNPAKNAQRPKLRPPDPQPPTPADAARLVEAAFELGDDWGTLVWLVMTTGMRRAEVAGLRWLRVDLDAEIIEIRHTYVQSKGRGREKDTKTHQMRRVALDCETVTLLRAHKANCRAELAEVGVELDEDMFVFMGARSADATTPYPPDAISRRAAAVSGGPTGVPAYRHCGLRARVENREARP